MQHQHIALPASYSPLQVAQSLYPEAFAAKDLNAVRRAWATAARELNRMNLPLEAGLTERSRAKQTLALQLTVDELQARASALYFVEGGWHERVQAETPRTSGFWLFLANGLSDNDSARKYTVARSGQKLTFRPTWNQSFLSLWVPALSETVKVRLKPWLSQFGAPDYEGSAEGLAHWAAAHLVLVHVVNANVSTH